MPADLLGHPLVALAVTVAVFVAAAWLNRRMRGHPVANPVLVSVCTVMALLAATGTSYDHYFAGAQFIHFLLGPATVALAVPIYRHLDTIRAAAIPILTGIMAGSAAGVMVIAVLAGFLPPIPRSRPRSPPTR